MLLYAMTWPPVFACSWGSVFLALRFPRDRVLREGAMAWIYGAGGILLASAIGLTWVWAVIGGVHMAIGVWIWWNLRRKDRKRALEALGAKSLARLAALVRKQREAARPRPVLRPAPGGAS
jgi:hypothetical protein